MRASKHAALILVATLAFAVLPEVFGAPGASSATVPAPTLAKFLPANYRVTSVKRVNLDGSRVPQEAVIAVGPVTNSGFATSLVVVLAWDSYVKRWTSVYDTLNQPSWQTSSQFGRGPGLLNLEGAGPQVKVVHDQPDGHADLLYWLNSIAGNTNYLIVGIIHFQHQIATQEYSFNQSYGHVFTMDLPSHLPIGPAVIGSDPTQEVKITLPWLTPDDSQSRAARMYYFTVAPHPKSFDSYQVVDNNQSYVGVELSNTSGSSSTVKYVDPHSSASGNLRVGDVIEGVVGSTLPIKDRNDLLGPIAIEEVALYYPDQTIELSVDRAGHHLTVKLKLAQWPSYQTSSYTNRNSGADPLM